MKGSFSNLEKDKNMEEILELKEFPKSTLDDYDMEHIEQKISQQYLEPTGKINEQYCYQTSSALLCSQSTEEQKTPSPLIMHKKYTKSSVYTNSFSIEIQSANDDSFQSEKIFVRKKAQSFLEKRNIKTKFLEKIQDGKLHLDKVSRKVSDPLQKRIKDFFNDKYDVYEKIGEGSVSVVKRCRLRDQKIDYAVKILRYQSEETLLNDIIKEDRILSLLNHENIAKKKFFEIDKSKKTAYIVMEYADGESLGQLIKNKKYFGESEIRKIMSQLFQAIKHIHLNLICHRDLSYNNILYSTQTQKIKVIDFSISQFLIGRDPLFANIGTLYFKAPEILSGEIQTQQIDMWALGITLYAIMKGKLPFTGQSENLISQQIINSEIDYSDLKYSEELINLLKGLLQKNPNQRLNPDQALEHQFITQKIKSIEDFYIPISNKSDNNSTYKKSYSRRNSFCNRYEDKEQTQNLHQQLVMRKHSSSNSKKVFISNGEIPESSQ